MTKLICINCYNAHLGILYELELLSTDEELKTLVENPSQCIPAGGRYSDYVRNRVAFLTHRCGCHSGCKTAGRCKCVGQLRKCGPGCSCTNCENRTSNSEGTLCMCIDYRLHAYLKLDKPSPLRIKGTWSWQNASILTQRLEKLKMILILKNALFLTSLLVSTSHYRTASPIFNTELEEFEDNIYTEEGNTCGF